MNHIIKVADRGYSYPRREIQQECMMVGVEARLGNLSTDESSES
jgi:hypothetical protein